MTKEKHKGLDSVLISSPDLRTSCRVLLWGATIVSWVDEEKEMLFVSNKSKYDEKKAIRGGVPLVFPQFGKHGESKMAQHGFARITKWSVKESAVEAYGAKVVFEICSNEESKKLWPHDFCLNYVVEVKAGSLSSTLECTNTDANPWKCQSLLHTYFVVPDIKTLRVAGFEGVEYMDQLNPHNIKNNILTKETSNAVEITKEVDRIMQDIYGKAKIPDIQLNFGGKQISVKIKKSAHMVSSGRWLNDVPCDVVLWNAWIDKCKSTGDMDTNDYQRYVCVEPGTVSKFVEVYPRDTLCLKQELVTGVQSFNI